MNKIVETGLKIDLHIHSCYSEKKDGEKVSENTLENINVLIDGLVKNEVNICAITDHDTFNYELYENLKKEESKENCIKKVLPGVEFSVKILDDDSKPKEIHIVTIFSDFDSEKVKNIENVLNNNQPVNGAFIEESFLNILRQIDLDTILIAHQKNYVNSNRHKPNDKNAFSLGEKTFNMLINSDYFEALEFKNKRNEIFNKQHIVDNHLEENIRYITGSDCHDWSVYPLEDKLDKKNVSDFPFTYAKCLPTFKGLVMAITDYSRLKTVNSFFHTSNINIPSIQITHIDDSIEIPLSKGINVIIGDNSIGKSMLLHKISSYDFITGTGSSKLKNGYDKYLQNLNLVIETQVRKDDIFIFDTQGEIRAKFEGDNLKIDELLKKYFPNDVDNEPYISIVKSEVDRIVNYLKEKFSIDKKLESLQTFNINIDQTPNESLVFMDNLIDLKVDTKGLSDIVDKITLTITQLEELTKLQVEKKDLDFINETKLEFENMKKRYEAIKTTNENQNKRIEKVNSTIVDTKQEYNKFITDKQKSKNDFESSTNDIIQSFINISLQKRKLVVYEPKMNKTVVKPNENLIYKYNFISKLNTDIIDINYLNNLIASILKKGVEIDWENITKEKLKDLVNSKKVNTDIDIIEGIKASLETQINEDFKIKNSIIEDGQDVYKELSSGMNAQIYFNLLAYEEKRKGVYLIDQPEDNISQNAIKSLLTRFRTMSEYRQVIIVTHNPQFIVNLDIDNLIYLAKKDKGLIVQSGALEYECEEYSVLDIVAENIDGGLDTIKKRWKRYEKNTNIL